MEDFVQRQTSVSSPGATGPCRGGGDGVGRILAAYGVEPAREGVGPEIEGGEEERESRGSSGEGPRRRDARRTAWDGAMLREVAGSLVVSVPDRQALVEKYPAIRDGGQ